MSPLNARPGPVNFEDAVAVRRIARVVSLGILSGAAAFAAVIASIGTGAPNPDPPTDHALYTPFVWVTAGLALLTTVVGTRMHTVQGTLAQRSQKTLTAHIVTLALSEGATFLGLILVLLTHSWAVGLPVALGLASLVTSIIRSEIRFNALVEEQKALER